MSVQLAEPVQDSTMHWTPAQECPLQELPPPLAPPGVQEKKLSKLSTFHFRYLVSICLYHLFIMPGSASVLIPAQATTFAHQIAQGHQSPALSRLKLTCGTWNISNSPAFSLTFSKVTLSGLAKLSKAAQKGHLPNHSKKSQKPMPCCAASWRACERRRSRSPAIAETRIETQLCLWFPAPGEDIMDFKNKERMTTLVTSN